MVFIIRPKGETFYSPEIVVQVHHDTQDSLPVYFARLGVFERAPAVLFVILAEIIDA